MPPFTASKLEVPAPSDLNTHPSSVWTPRVATHMTLPPNSCHSKEQLQFSGPHTVSRRSWTVRASM